MGVKERSMRSAWILLVALAQVVGCHREHAPVSRSPDDEGRMVTPREQFDDVRVSAEVKSLDKGRVVELTVVRANELQAMPLVANDFSVVLITRSGQRIKPDRVTEEGIIPEIGMGPMSTGCIAFEFGESVPIGKLASVLVRYRSDERLLPLHRFGRDPP